MLSFGDTGTGKVVTEVVIRKGNDTKVGNANEERPKACADEPGVWPQG